MTTFAVAMACRNRREKSVRIVEQLLKQQNSGRLIKLFAVDDGSSDGTSAALKELGCEVIVGDGTWFWAGGMRRAHAAAASSGADVVVWINDDLDLRDDALDQVEKMFIRHSDSDILIGPVVSYMGGISYGGRIASARNPMSFSIAGERMFGQEVDAGNGNFVAIPRTVAQQVIFPSKYKHGYADLVFCIEARKHGFTVRQMAAPVGYDAGNPATGRMFDRDVKFRERVSFALSPFGIPPRDHFRFARLTAGRSAPFWLVRSYMRVLFPK